MTGKQKKMLLRIAISLVLLIIVHFLPFVGIGKTILYFAVYILIGGGILIKSAKNIMRGSFFDENFLMAVATVGAFCIGEYSEAVFVMLFFQIGELLESYAVGKTRKSIASLMDIRPDYANKIVGGSIIKISPEEAEIGDEIIVRAGERIPLDGVVVSGSTAIDSSAITGESLPIDVGEGDEVVSGCVNLSGVVTVRVKKKYGDSTVAKILNLVENASMKKAPAEKFITKFSKYYTPAVIGMAVCVAVFGPLVTGSPFVVWFKNALIFLVISCPCALVISVPLSFFAGIGGASKKGLLVKGSNYFELLSKAKVAVFDKTGTLTEGKFAVREIFSKNGYSADEVLRIAASAEKYTLHPIGCSVRESYSGKILDVEKAEEISGKGVRSIVNGKVACIGNMALMKSENVSVDDAELNGVYVAYDGIYIGRIIISDSIKPTAKVAIEALKKLGIKRTVMLTGDSSGSAEEVAREIGIDEVYSSLLPDEKVNILEEIISDNDNGSVIYTGDGINDAPVLARADVGIGMGAIGSDAAVEAADVVLMDDDLLSVAKALKISQKTLSIVNQNIIFSLGVKIAVMILSVFSMAQMWLAVIADVGVMLIAVLNSLRAMKQ